MPIPAIGDDAAAFLSRRSPAERHAIARILAPDGEGLACLAWIIAQPDSDPATLAMVFWRLRCVPPEYPKAFAARKRSAVLADIAQQLAARDAAPALLAWDGREAWTLAPLIGAAPLPGITDQPEAAARLQGPFGTHQPEPALFAFLDEPYAKDDIFDPLWLYHYDAAAIVDLLDAMPAEAWLAAIKALCASHPGEAFEWMIDNPRCTDAVAAMAFRMCDDYALRCKIAARWHEGHFGLSGLDYSAWAWPVDPDHDNLPAALHSSPPGRKPDLDMRLDHDFAWWVACGHYSGLVPRPRAEALKSWQQTQAPAQAGSAADAGDRQDGKAGRKPGPDIETQNRNFLRLNLLTLLCAVLTFGLWRLGLDKPAAIAFFAALLGIPAYLAFVPVGSARRQAAWFASLAGLGMAFAFVMRFIDKGAI